MAYLGEVELGPKFPPFIALRKCFGFVPNLFRIQSLLARVVEAEAAIVGSLLMREQALSRVRKERILVVLAARNRSRYAATLHYQNLFVLGSSERQLDQILSDHSQAGLSPEDVALLDFAVRLHPGAPPVTRAGMDSLYAHGWTDESILEAVAAAAWANFASTVSRCLDIAPDFEPIEIPPAQALAKAPEASEPYIRTIDPAARDFAALRFVRQEFGFIPNFLGAQVARPEVVDAQGGALTAILLPEDFLTRRQKACILLAVSAANRDAYAAALSRELLRNCGVTAEEADQIVMDPREARLPETDKVLLDCSARLDLEPLRVHGFGEAQILEAAVTTSLAVFLNTLANGLGAPPDFAARPLPLASKTVHPFTPDLRPTGETSLAADPDAQLVARIRAGDVDAFEDLMNRHCRRVYRTLVGILGNEEDARDATQETFLKAFQHLGTFEGRSKLSTWIVSIASNTGMQFLRERKRVESLDDQGFPAEEGFRPRELQAWTDNPEQLCSKAEMRALVENSVRKLPARYRVVLVLRDIEQLSIEEAAATLGLGVPALKARLLRGRLMVREALAPRFAMSAKGDAA